MQPGFAVVAQVKMKNEQQIAAIRAQLEKPLVLIGMMGAGKTTQGRKLAEFLGIEFVDSDIEIEAEQKMQVSDIFAQFGESHFRELEKDKISQLIDGGVKVISVGGGAVTNSETMAAILSKTLCIWIDAPIAVLAKRTSGTGTRPLLNGGDAEEILGERMAQRRHLYEQAHIRANGVGAADQVALNTLGQIYDYLLKEIE